MQESPRSKIARSRRSCEPCRRKKVRCDGGRPTCSFCRRLNQDCMYKNRRGELITETNSPIASPTNIDSSTGRLQALESKVDGLYGLLQARGAETFAETRSTSEQTDSGDTHTQQLYQTTEGKDDARDDQITNIDGSTRSVERDSVNHAVQIYVDHIHGQPLHLFEPSNLASQIQTWPTFLLEVFYISISRWSSRDLVADTDRFALLRKARQEIMSHALDVRLNVQILQGLCLLIVEEIAASDTRGAWMSIAVGARLTYMSKLLPKIGDDSEWLKATWSLHVLDSIYCSSLGMVRALPRDFSPASPRAHQQPQPMDHISSSNPYQSIPEPSRRSYINDCYSAILSVWADALDLLKVGEKNRLPAPWSGESPYRSIVAKLYDFETELLQIHRVRHMRPDLRSANDLQADRLYWSTWFSVQILFHGVQAMINHPVLHIAGISRSQHRRPPSFLQHTVDELFQHSGWVQKLIELGAEKKFVLNDPFIAHVTAIVATGWMFFINSDDPPLAKQAELGFDASYTFVDGFASKWPHLKHSIRKLDLLRESVNTKPSVRAPSIQASLLWSLFDYSSSTTTTLTYETKSSSRLELGVATQYLSTSDSLQTPRIEDSQRKQFLLQTEVSESNGMLSEEGFLQETDFSLFDSTLFAGFQPSSFGDDFFADFGQL